jgi:hypothetical protein
MFTSPFFVGFSRFPRGTVAPVQGEEIKDMDDLTMVLFRDPSSLDGIRGKTPWFYQRRWGFKQRQT